MSSNYAARGGSPQRLDKYELHERLGRGGMAEVWKAFDTQLQRYVAIKLLHPDLQHDPNFIARFVREARFVASLKHPNIVQIYDFQISQGSGSAGESYASAYMVMEYVQGQTLASYIARTSRQKHFPSPQDILHLFTSISRAVDYAHQHGMIHRDIKPANILLDQRNTTYNAMGEPMLTDFGLVKLLGASTGSLSGSWLGTPLYIAPEQAQGYPGNEHSDIYALGVILYELFTGVLPFSGTTPAVILQQHLHANPPSPMLLNPTIPPPLAMVIMRCLAKDPAARYGSASSLTEALAEALEMLVPEHMDTVISSPDPASEPTHVGVPLQTATEQENSQSSLHSQAAAFSPTLPSPAEEEFGQGGKHVEGANSPFVAVPSVAFSAGRGSQPEALSSEISLPATPSSSRLVADSAAPVTPLLTALPFETGNRPTVERLSPPPPSLQPPTFKKARKRQHRVLLALLALLILISGIGSFLLLHNQPSGNTIAATTVVGHAYFLSSGLLDERNSQGEADEFEIDLQHIPAPAAGKTYYAWLLRDIVPKGNEVTIRDLLLGRLSVHNGTVHLLYNGDQQHTNLISLFSRFLITEEPIGNNLPTQPSTNQLTWRYYAILPQTPNPLRHRQSALDALRSLLYEGGPLHRLGIHGGPTVQLFRHTQKVWEFVNSARDSWQAGGNGTAFIRRQIIRTLDYLDGLPAVQRDVPPGTPLLVDKQLVQVPLIDNAQGIGLESYAGRVNDAITVFINSPGVTPEMRQIAIPPDRAMLFQVLPLLKQVRQDAKQLIHMTDAQLSSQEALSLLDDMVTNANYAFNGKLDPETNEVQPGVVQIYYDIQHLETFTVTPYK